MSFVIKMLISTGKGDKGFTKIGCNISVRKDDPRVEAYGSIDELSSIIGYIASVCKEKGLINELKDIQKDLYLLCSDITNPEKEILTKSAIEKLEKKEMELEKMLPPITKFILPGGTEIAALLHIARAVCRRCERNVVKAMDKHKINKNVLIYLNRLSDLLYLMARKKNFEKGINEEEVGVKDE